MAKKPMNHEDGTPMSVEEAAKEYVAVLEGRPDGWGQYCHPHFGASHYMLGRMWQAFGKREAQAAIDQAFTDYYAEKREAV